MAGLHSLDNGSNGRNLFSCHIQGKLKARRQKHYIKMLCRRGCHNCGGAFGGHTCKYNSQMECLGLFVLSLKLSGADLPDVFGLVVFARHTPFVFVPLYKEKDSFPLKKEKCSVIIFK